MGFKGNRRGGGDGGYSELGGSRRFKGEPVFDVLGDLDELGAAIGLVRAHADAESAAYCLRLQDALIRLSGELAGRGGGLTSEDQAFVEASIDAMERRLDPPSSFVRPGGNVPSAFAHAARAASRRAERSLFRYLAGTGREDAAAARFLNRLSDCLFLLALELEDRPGKG